MRIAIDLSPISRTFPQPFPLGVQRAVRSTIAALDRRDDVEMIKVAPPGTGSLAWWRQTAFLSECKNRSDLVHSWTSAFPLRAPVPVIQTIHEAPWLHGATENAGPGHRVWARLGRMRAALVITPSPSVAADLGGHSKLRVVPWGVGAEFSPAHNEADAELHAAVPDLPEGPFVLCLGGTRPKKRLDLLLSGIAALPHELAVVCTGPPTPEAQALALAYPQLLLTGVLEERWIPALLRAAACAAILSTSEGFGLPALECLASGTPVIVARGTVQAETAAGFGIEVNPADPASVAQGIERALGESESSARRAGGLAHAKERTWDRTAENLVAAWGSLL